MKKIVVYAGSFDPPTLGHTWIIHQAAQLFDEVIVAVGVNPEKKSLFSVTDRMRMLEGSLHTLLNVTVTQFTDQYLVQYAASIDAAYIIRGIRNGQDYEYERSMRHVNEELEKNISTVFLMPPRHLAEISSSTVKGLIGPYSWEEVVRHYVPIQVFLYLLNAKHDTWRILEKRGAQPGTDNMETFWNSIIVQYLMEDRHYHTLSHITDMLGDYREVKHLLADAESVEIAIWYHDVIYSTTSAAKENERASAQYAEQVLAKLGLPPSFRQKISALILATTHADTPEDLDAQYLVDIDLAVLGKPADVFDRYEANIRKEYHHVSDNDFKQGRAAILKRFLDRPFIYATEYFRNKYEATARNNIEYSIKNLEQ